MNETYCLLRVVPEFAGSPPGVPLPDAHWGVDYAGHELRFTPRTPGSLIPFTRRTLLLSTADPRPAVFALGGVRWRLDPPGGANECHYWGAERRDPCPAAAACPYRANIVRVDDGPGTGGTHHESRVELNIVPVTAPQRNLFLLADRPANHPNPNPDLAPLTGVITLPPVAVAAAPDAYLALFATRLRAALLAGRQPGDWLRSDVLVAAADFPGVREAHHSGTLAGLDLEESFPPVRAGETPPVTQMVLVRMSGVTSLNHPTTLWQAVYSLGDSADPVLLWLQRVIRSRLAVLGVRAEWVRGPEPGELFPHEQPPWDYYAAETAVGPGRTLTAVGRRLAAYRDGGADLAGHFAAHYLARTEPFPRDEFKARLFDLTLRLVPGGFLAPPGTNRFPGQLFDWWVRAGAGPGGVASRRDELAALLTTSARGESVRVPGRRVAGPASGPVRLVLGRPALNFQVQARGWTGILAGLPT